MCAMCLRSPCILAIVHRRRRRRRAIEAEQDCATGVRPPASLSVSLDFSLWCACHAVLMPAAATAPVCMCVWGSRTEHETDPEDGDDDDQGRGLANTNARGRRARGGEKGGERRRRRGSSLIVLAWLTSNPTTLRRSGMGARRGDSRAEAVDSGEPAAA
jgi:hypothetical protein